MKPPTELSSLIEKHLDGLLSDDEFAQLQQILKSDAAARQQFRRYLNLDAALYDQIEGDQLALDKQLWQSPPTSPIEKPKTRKPFLQSFALPLAASLTVGILVWWIQSSTVSTDKETLHQGFAILTRMVDAEWENSAPPHSEGQILPAGHLQLKSGLAQVEFFSGATVILQGQADLEIISTSEARCLSGKVRAHVPPAARGFILRTPKGDIVDLGTDFAVDISDQQSQVHVFEGEIEVHQKEQQVRSLTTGQGFELVSRSPNAQAPKPGTFISLSDLDDRFDLSEQSRFAKWQSHSQNLRKDPNLIAYYPFDQPGSWQRTLKNEALSGSELDGAIVGARRVEGRWPYPKNALEFKPTGSRTRVFIPGEFASISFVCWARIDSLDRQYNALFLSDNFQEGELHWQIRHDGKLMLSLMHAEGKKGGNRTYFSPPIWDKSMSGQWIHLASVFDTEKQSITHYVNGKSVSNERITPAREVHTTRIGAGEIGNWGLPLRADDPWFAIRNLNGAIDEFAIFSTALSAERILKMYELGKP
ncbi:MAG: FecR domain-containing protein [Verrucomicrobiales bacterium]|nr:FecR domain-containing protein [Verrucomicrobiales bacterium]